MTCEHLFTHYTVGIVLENMDMDTLVKDTLNRALSFREAYVYITFGVVVIDYYCHLNRKNYFCHIKPHKT